MKTSHLSFGKILLLLTSLLGSVQSQFYNGECQDKDIEFVLFSNDIVKCDWITSKNVATRRKNWCTGAEFNGQVIYQDCPVSCDLCGCKDNPYFKYKFWNSDISGVTYGCDMLTDKADVIDVRRQRWCQEEGEGDVWIHCPKSCGLCTEAPTPAPSLSPIPSIDTNDQNPKPKPPTPAGGGDNKEKTKAPKTKAPTKPTTPPTRKPTNQPTFKPTKAPEAKKTKSPEKAKTAKSKAPEAKKTKSPAKSKAPEAKKTKQPSKPKKPKKCKKMKEEKKEEVNMSITTSGKLSLTDLKTALCPNAKEEGRRLRSLAEEDFAISSLDVKSLKTEDKECTNGCVYSAKADVFYTGEPTDAAAFNSAVAAFVNTNAGQSVSSITVDDETVGGKGGGDVAKAEGANTIVDAGPGANMAVVAGVMAAVGISVMVVGFLLFKKVRSARSNDADESMSMGSAPSFRDTLRPKSKVKYTNGKHLTGNAGFPVSVNKANDEYEVDSLVQI